MGPKKQSNLKKNIEEIPFNWIEYIKSPKWISDPLKEDLLVTNIMCVTSKILSLLAHVIRVVVCNRICLDIGTYKTYV